MLKKAFGKRRAFFICAVISFSVFGQSSPLPDPRITPGAIDTSVTQENIHSTVCVRGYTGRVRPDKQYTNRLKHEQLRQYRYQDLNPANYEQDHLIPLIIGGNPSDPNNLWPQPRLDEWSAEQKNDLEFVVYKMVCRGEISLKEAQQRVAGNWIQAYKDWVPSHRYLLPKHRRNNLD
ncbi:MAG: hypothetical protein EXR37_00410 [Limnohabitans sp.]|nr:hypothetical protein [Limnohabitans sp.]